MGPGETLQREGSRARRIVVLSQRATEGAQRQGSGKKYLRGRTPEAVSSALWVVVQIVTETIHTVLKTKLGSYVVQPHRPKPKKELVTLAREIRENMVYSVGLGMIAWVQGRVREGKIKGSPTLQT